MALWRNLASMRELAERSLWASIFERHLYNRALCPYRTCSYSYPAQSVIAMDILTNDKCKLIDMCKTKSMGHDFCYFWLYDIKIFEDYLAYKINLADH